MAAAAAVESMTAEAAVPAGVDVRGETDAAAQALIEVEIDAAEDIIEVVPNEQVSAGVPGADHN